jgi:hypothetical protein
LKATKAAFLRNSPSVYGESARLLRWTEVRQLWPKGIQQSDRDVEGSKQGLFSKKALDSKKRYLNHAIGSCNVFGERESLWAHSFSLSLKRRLVYKPGSKIFIMKIDYSGSLMKAMRFCILPKRWLPFFVIDLSFASVALIALVANMPYFIYFLSGLEDLSMLGPALNLLLSLMLLFAGWILLNIWITGSLIHQSYKEKEFGQSWSMAGKKYLSLLGVAAITAIISLIVGVIPYIGWLISIFVGLVFYFGLQSVMVKGNGFMAALKDSMDIFRKHPFKVFLAWLVVSALSLLILLVFAIPVLALLFNMIIDLSSLAGTEAGAAVLMNLMFAVQNQMPQMLITGAIALIGMAITRTFALKAQTEFYNQFKKK